MITTLFFPSFLHSFAAIEQPPAPPPIIATLHLKINHKELINKLLMRISLLELTAFNDLHITNLPV